MNMPRARAFAMLAVVAAAAVAIPLATPAPEAQAAISRIGGADRYEVSARLSERNPDPGDTVFLVSGTRFPDALTAGPVAAAERGHMLLTHPDFIPDRIVDRIEALSPDEIVVVGGDASISQQVLATAASLAPTVTRIAGADRVANAFLLMDRMIAKGTIPARVWVVSGRSFADALSAGAIAARNGHGLLLTFGADDAFRQQLERRLQGVVAISIAGGEASVDASTQDYLASQRPTERIGGATRYEVAANINAIHTRTVPSRTMLLANGADFPDGLGAAVLAGSLEMPLFLTQPQCRGTASVATVSSQLGIRDTIAVGGPRSVSDAAARLEACFDVGVTAAEVVRIVNAHRTSIGLQPLATNGSLMQMAQGWSGSMAAQQTMVHSTTFCSETFAMGFRRCAENIARTGTSSAATVMDLWMNSPGHRANILNPNLTSIGVGIVQGADGRWYWTQNFGGY